MLKKSLIALGALAVMAVAAPAFANTDSVFGLSTPDQVQFAKQAVEQQLQQKGVNVTGVDEWNGYIRADVRLADGGTAVQYFEPGSLQPVSVNHID